MRVACTASLLAALLAAASPALGQSSQPTPPATSQAKDGAPAPLVVLFDVGSSRIRPQDEQVLDQASRAYSAGRPLVMIVTGAADTVGKPASNLSLSQKRASAVLRGLLDRGIPAERFQVLAKGQTEPAVPTADGVAEVQNRRVEISWR